MNAFHLLAACVKSTTPGKLNACEIGVDNPILNEHYVINNVLGTVYAWAGIICVLVIIIAGYFFVTSSGNAAQIKRAKDAIMGAAIGLVVVIMAFTITQFVLGRFN